MGILAYPLPFHVHMVYRCPHQNQTLSNGTTGRVGFDEMGDRIYAEYQIVNVQMNTKSKNKMTVGYYNYSKVSLQFLDLLYLLYVQCTLLHIKYEIIKKHSPIPF